MFRFFLTEYICYSAYGTVHIILYSYIYRGLATMSDYILCNNLSVSLAINIYIFQNITIQVFSEKYSSPD
jgi:hypothetical protein